MNNKGLLIFTLINLCLIMLMIFVLPESIISFVCTAIASFISLLLIVFLGRKSNKEKVHTATIKRGIIFGAIIYLVMIILALIMYFFGATY